MRTIINIVTLLLLTSFPERLLACSCIGQRTVEEEVNHADAVLVGTILSKHFLTLTDSSMRRMFPDDTIMNNSLMSNLTIVHYDLMVQDIFKGNVTMDTLTIYTGLGGGDCGIRFEIGKKYIVYGENETYFGQINSGYKFPTANNTFWTYSCLRTTSYFEEEIIEIEKYIRSQEIEKVDVVYTFAEIMPTFKEGGESGLKEFISRNLRYPETGESLIGKVYVEFTVDTLGYVKDVEIKRGLTPFADQEAIRVVKMLTFNPGTNYGLPVATKMILPISFTLE